MVWLALLADAGLAQSHRGKITQIRDQATIGSARVGIYVVDTATGEELVALSADEAFIPASNMKLLTSGVALSVLGPDFAFRTELVREGDRLVFRGSGDPALGDPKILSRLEPPLTVEQVLDLLAGAVKKAGMTRVSEFLVDDRVFDREFVHPTWPTDQLNRWYCAEVSGLNFHANVLAVFPRPSPDGAGAPPMVKIEPESPLVELTNKARTTSKGQNSAWLVREPTSNRFTLFGEVRIPMQVPVEVTVHDNARFAGDLLVARLARLQIQSPAARAARDEEDLSGGQAVAAVTTPLSEILQRCNSDSQNLYAEALLKRVGHEVTGQPGSWGNGASVVRMVLGERLGAAATASTSVADGSGMSRENTLTPRTLGNWLRVVAQDKRLGPAFVSSLAVPGRGTLEARFHDKDTRLGNELSGKSGAINGVRTLSGYLTHPTTGRRLAFSILVNEIEDRPAGQRPFDPGQAKRLHEEIVVALDRWLTEQAETPALGG